MGACFVSGALEQLGVQVYYYDLNMALNGIRKKKYLSCDDKLFLTNINILKSRIKVMNEDSDLDTYLDSLVENIKYENYDMIALSMDYMNDRTVYSVAILHFAIKLSFLLKKKFKNIPVFAGGRRLFRTLKNDHLEKIISTISDLPIDCFFTGDAHDAFPKFVKDYFERGKEIIPFSKRREDSDLSKTLEDILPKYDIINLDDMYVSYEDLFIEEIIEKYPEIKKIEPFFIAPYKFSDGCPYKCHYCVEGALDRFFHFNFEKTINILKKLNESGITNFKFFNNNLNYSKSFVKQFTSGIKEAKINILYSDSANLQVVSPDVLEMLSTSGCIELILGSETVSKNLLKRLNKVNEMDRTITAFNDLIEYNIWCASNIIHSFPFETEEDFNELLDFMRKKDLIDAVFVNVFHLDKTSEMGNKPEKFNIRRYPDHNETNKSYMFDEVGGLSWNQLRYQSRQKERMISNIWTEEEACISRNDYILFGLYGLGMHKSKIKKIMADYLKVVRSLGIQEQFASFFSIWKLSEKHIE